MFDTILARHRSNPSARLLEMGRNIWNLLDDEEREKYYNEEGSLGFVVHLCDMLHIDINSFTPEEFNRIHDDIVTPEGLRKATRGIWHLRDTRNGFTIIVESYCRGEGHKECISLKGFYAGEQYDSDDVKEYDKISVYE